MSYTIAVRALCEFTAKQGDLDLRFTPSPSAQEGMAGHSTVTSRRNKNYQREVSLSGAFGLITLRGRADGYDPERQILEEIKTYRGDLNTMPENQRQLHWAQTKIYGYLMCQKLALTSITLALVYFDIGTQKETVLKETRTTEELKLYVDTLCKHFLQWAEQEMAHRHSRDLALREVAFPHTSFRVGQRQLAEAMYKASHQQRCLLAQAPTGIGKTIGSIFPMLKASAEHHLDKLFFLSAKTSGRQLALDALSTLKASAPGLPLRVLELVAKATACEHPDKACHGDSCPLAKGFYDRLPAARSAALNVAILDKQNLREVALAHQVCPYYLSSEMARWSDVIIGDYNYYFDLSALLYGLTIANDWRVGVLVDEAHNMVARARSMYSAELNHITLKIIRKHAPAELKKPLDKLHHQWQQLEKSQVDSYQVHEKIPDKWMNALQAMSTATGAYFADHPSLVEAELQSF